MPRFLVEGLPDPMVVVVWSDCEASIRRHRTMRFGGFVLSVEWNGNIAERDSKQEAMCLFVGLCHPLFCYVVPD